MVIDLGDNIEGYIRANELSQNKEETDVLKKIKPGDEITAQVIGFDKRNKQVNLSVRRYTTKLEKERVSDFNSSQAEPNATLGDLFNEKLKSINNDEVV